MDQAQFRRHAISFLLSQVALAVATRSQSSAQDPTEAFALAADRGQVLQQLLPGSEDDYYFRCLAAQHRGDLAAVPPILAAWRRQHPESAERQVIENRQLLLQYGVDPKATLAALRSKLGLRFDAQRHTPGARAELPSALDAGLLDPARLMQRALAPRGGRFDDVTNAGLWRAGGMQLADEQVVNLLARVVQPDLPNLVSLLVRHARLADATPIERLPVFENLLLSQLDELALQLPEQLANSAFVRAYLQRLAPPDGVDLRSDARERTAWFDRAWAFAERLPVGQSPVKALIMHHRLRHDWALGAVDRGRFISYLRLPRPADYASDQLRAQWRDAPNSFAAVPVAMLPEIAGDHDLVRAYLAHFCVREQGYEEWARLLREEWVRKVYAEAKLVAGEGVPEQLLPLLGSADAYRSLEQRVDLEFAPTMPREFGADAPVSLEVDVKNVSTLLVKVFAIDAYAYQRDTGRNVDASLPLDGLVASSETTHRFTEPPLRRVRRRFDLADLAAPGTYVVELLGNGVSSRAVIHKGSLHYTVRPGAAGQVVTVRNRAGAALAGATVWFAGQEFTADGNGEVNLPYGEQAGKQPLILRQGNVSTLLEHEQKGESYTVTAPMFVERQALVSGHSASVLVRPQLLLNGVPVSLALLEGIELTVNAVDRQGVPSVRTVRDLRLVDDRELVVPIQVPEGLAKLSVALRGRVQSLTQRKPVDLSATSAVLELNRIDATVHTSAPLLGRDPEGYFIDLLGRNGEPKVGRSLQVRLGLREFKQPLDVSLATDARGRVRLGALPGVASVRVLGLPTDPGEWPLEAEISSLPGAVVGVVGTPLRVVYPRASERARFSLWEKRGGRHVRDLSAQAMQRGGFIELRELPAGEFELWLADLGHAVPVSVVAGEVRDGYVFGATRWLPLSPRAPAQVESLQVDGDDVVVRLAGAGSRTRVHVLASRYELAEAPRRLEGRDDDARRGTAPTSPPVDYQAGRQLGEEYRYVLDRRFAKKFPGNLLNRPGLLLNPWALAPTRADADAPVAASESFEGNAWNTAVGLGGGRGGRFGGRGATPGLFANLDFLASPSGLQPNLIPDRDGVVRVPRRLLGDGQILHAIVVDGADVAYRSTALAEQPLRPRPRQLQKVFDATQHLAEHARIEFVAGGGRAVVDAAAAAQVQTFVSLADVFRLFTAVSGDQSLQEFGFVLRWPTLGDADKRDLYSRHACHELHFFLHQKDRAFFDAVVRPYLADKLHKTFLDEWLLDADLEHHTDPWAFARLNLVEQILLLQRLPGERDNAVRLLRERLDLLPRDPDRARRLFEVALRSGDLEREEEHLVREKLAEGKTDPAAKDKAGVPPSAGGGGSGRPAAAGPASPGPGGPTGGGVAAANPAAKPAAKARVDDLQAAAEPAPSAADTSFLGDAKKSAELAKDMERRGAVRELYRAPDKTQRFIEHNYWHRTPAESGADLIATNEFWLDYATRPEAVAFCSPQFVAATGNFTEMMFALAVLDLPFTAEVPPVVREGDTLSLRPATPLLLARQEIKPATPATRLGDVLVAQSFFRVDDRFREEGGERVDRFVTGEFVVDVAYGAQVVLTNPTSTRRKLDLLLQIPEGALPLQGGRATRSVSVTLEPFGTAQFDYLFYFPSSGDFAHYPAHASKGGTLVAAAAVAQAKLRVVATPSEVDTTSWQHVSQNGSEDEVIEFLGRANLQQVDLDAVAWRLRDKTFYGRLTTLLRARHVWHAPTFAHALLHGDEAAAREYLRGADSFVAQCGPALRSPLLTIDPVERGAWQIVEFDPLFNARAHRRAQQPVIRNHELAAQYRSFLDVLCHEPAPTPSQLVLATYYLLLQDRVEEALAVFARVDQRAVSSKLQVDYLRCYLAFFTEDRATARALAAAHVDHPVTRWRNLFRDVVAQLDEADGKAPADGDPADRERRLGELAASAPQLDLQVVGSQVLIRHKNLASCELRLFRTDVEFAFSTSPFVQQGAQSIAWLKPHRSQAVALGVGGETTVELPADLRGQNLLVEVRGQGLVRRAPAVVSALSVQTSEAYGQLQVLRDADKRPLAKAYVKVYARDNAGAVRFYKDGYTDLRGRFDYASLSGPSAPVERFALLVLSEADGAVIREVAPPGK